MGASGQEGGLEEAERLGSSAARAIEPAFSAPPITSLPGEAC